MTTVAVPAHAVATRGAYAYLLRITTAAGAVPALVDPGSRDPRYLGVLMDVPGREVGRAGGL